MAAQKRSHEGEVEVDVEDGPSPSKAPRMALEHFEKGSIIKIRVKNFMTYNEATFKPGPRLNLVLAPNGTGKSSLTCALCLGLAGHPSILGRADNPKDFIQRGTTEAVTEITLSSGDPSRHIVVRRRLTKDGSKYFINGAEKNKTDVLKILKDLNIQLDNLCQFLPQDRVVAFSQMKPEELLRESERAMGDSHLHSLHQELVEDGKNLKVAERSAGALQRKLEDEEMLMNEVQRDKERFDQRRGIEERADLIEKKMLYLDYGDALDRFQATLQKVRQGEERLQQIKQEVARHRAPLKAKEADEQKLKGQMATQKKVVLAKQNALEAFNNLSDDLNTQLGQKWDAIGALKTQAEQNAEHIAKLEADVARLQQELDALPNDAAQPTQGTQAQPSNELRLLRQEHQELVNEARRFDDDMDQLRETLHGCDREMKMHQDQMARLDSARHSKLRHLEQYNRGITSFANWVADNKARFKGDVYGPILLEVTVADTQHAKYLEQQLPRNMWSRFVTVYREDQDALHAEAKRQNVKIITSNYSASPSAPLQHPDGPASQYAAFNITHTLDEVFEAPPVIKRVLNDESAITRAYIGTARTDADAFLRTNPNIMNLYTPESNYRVRVSAYNSAARSQQVRAIIERCQSLGDAKDNTEEREKIQKAIHETQQTVNAVRGEMSAMNAVKADAEARAAHKKKELQKAEDEFSKAKRLRMKVTSTLNTKRKLLEEARRKPDPMSREPGLRQDINKLNAQAHKLVQKVASDLRGQWEAMKVLACTEARACELHQQIKALREHGRGSGERQAHLERLLGQLAQVREQDKKEALRRKRIAHEAIERTPEVDAAFAAMPTDRAELQEAIDDLKREAAGIQCANPRVMQEYEERSRRIRELRETFGNQSNALETLTAALEAKKAQWLPELQRMVGVVNKHFGANLRAMGCAGEVSLFCGCEAGFDACNAFDKYAIHIRVKFRDDEDLQLLTANRQSGGERAVSTILYIVALQFVTVCPFRVVDEINQGMDQINERKVFIRMVDAACRPGTPQSFMFTPKLLPDLPYSRDVYPMFIFNGVQAEALTKDFQEDSLVGGMPKVYTA